MNRRAAKPSAVWSDLWVSIVAMILTGGVVLGGTLLFIALSRLPGYTGFGDRGVYELLALGFPIAGISAALLIVFAGWRGILRVMHRHTAVLDL